MDSVGDRIKARRLELGMSQTELATRLGESKQTLYKYESGLVENIPLAKLRRIAEILACSPAYLACWEDYKSADELSALYETLNKEGLSRLVSYGRALSARAEYRRAGAAPQTEYIRHYLSAAAAGYAAPIEGEDYELIERRGDIPAQADFAIDIDGDSMEPYIRSGETVYVKLGTDLQEFDAGIFFVDGDVYCKQWCRDYSGTLHLLSANPARQDANISIRPDSGRSCVCFGKVLLERRLPRPEYF